MDKTPFSNKCEILNDFYMDYSGSDEYGEFIELNDLGIPAAVLSFSGAAILTDIGIKHVEDTWIALCELLEIDYHGEYESLSHMMEFANE